MRRRLVLLGGACLLSACNHNTATSPSTTAVQAVSVSPASAQLTVGQTQQFSVSVLPATATNKSVTWTVSPQSAGTIDANGLFTAQAAGTATITATSVATPAITGFASATIAAAPPKNPPVIKATLMTVLTGPNYLGDPQSVQVCADSACATPISDATVTLNGSALKYDSLKLRYTGSLSLGLGASYSLKVTTGGSDYTASGTQFTTFPTVTSPAAGATWDAGVANTMTWTSGAPTAGATNFLGIVDATGKIYYPSGNKPLEVPITSTSYTIAPGWTTRPGDYYIYDGIGTPGIGNSGAAGLPIANAAPGSGVFVGGMVSLGIVHVF